LGVVVVLAAGALQGCGGGGGAKPTPTCTLTSDCNHIAPGKGLVCALGYCVSMCNESVDCVPAPQLCVKTDMGNVCRAPEAKAKGCAQNSDCSGFCTDPTNCPIVCGRDLTCRTQCATSVDCLKGQVCTVSGSCADPKVDTTYDSKTNDFKPITTGVAGSGGGGNGGAIGNPGTGGDMGTAGASGTMGTAGASGTTGMAGSSPDGGAGTGTAGTGMDAGNPEVALTPDGVMVMPATKLRQGQGIGITVTITKAAGGLSNPMGIDFGDLKATVVADMSTDKSLVLRITVPHGVPLGKRTLKVSTAGGIITATDVVEITAITAAPTGTDAATNTGTVDLPYRSLKQAIAVADVGDTIHLVDGTYSALPTASGGSGETWGYMIPADLTVVGDTTAGTILDGVSINSVDGFDVVKSLTLQNMTIQDFRYGVDVSKDTSTLKMTDVVMTSNSSYALNIETNAANSTVTIAGMKTNIGSSTQAAIFASSAHDINVTINDATIQSGGDVIYWTGNMSGAKLTLTNATVKQLMTYNAINFTYINNTTTGTSLTLNNSTITGSISDQDAKGSITVMGGTITQKSNDVIGMGANTLTMTGTTITMTANNSGIYITSGIGSLISLKNVMISGGGRGIYQNGAGSQLKLRGTTIQNTMYDAIYLTNGNLDMGTMTESGDNFLASPVSNPNYYYYCINISRSQGTATPVTAMGSAIGAQGAVPAPQTIDATAGTQSALPKWNVYTGNKLVFF
jgi:hypothetical protein